MLTDIKMSRMLLFKMYSGRLLMRCYRTIPIDNSRFLWGRRGVGRHIKRAISHQFAFKREEPNIFCLGNGQIPENMSGIPNWMTLGRYKTLQEITGNEEYKSNLADALETFSGGTTALFFGINQIEQK